MMLLCVCMKCYPTFTSFLTSHVSCVCVCVCACVYEFSAVSIRIFTIASVCLNFVYIYMFHISFESLSVQWTPYSLLPVCVREMLVCMCGEVYVCARMRCVVSTLLNPISSKALPLYYWVIWAKFKTIIMCTMLFLALMDYMHGWPPISVLLWFISR